MGSNRTHRNESECSFTLTDDEERENIDGNRRSTQKRSSFGTRSSSIRKGSSQVKQQSPSLMMIAEMGETNPFAMGSEVKAVEEADDEDLFLKEIENENRLIEEELKCIL